MKTFPSEKFALTLKHHTLNSKTYELTNQFLQLGQAPQNRNHCTHCLGWCLGRSLMHDVNYEYIVPCAAAHR